MYEFDGEDQQLEASSKEGESFYTCTDGKLANGDEGRGSHGAQDCGKREDGHVIEGEDHDAKSQGPQQHLKLEDKLAAASLGTSSHAGDQQVDKIFEPSQEEQNMPANTSEK